VARLVATSQAGFVFHILPYFWLLVLLLAMGLAYREVKRMRRGYKLPLLFVSVGYIAITFIIGGVIYASGLAATLEESSANLPMYTLVSGHRRIWTETNNGLLAGKVVKIDGSVLTITDLKGQNWMVTIGTDDLLATSTLNRSLKFIGTQTGPDTFTATEVRPWCGCVRCLEKTTTTCSGRCGQ